MAASFHVGPQGPGLCSVDSSNPRSKGCPFKGAKHFPTLEAAQAEHQRQEGKRYEVFPSTALRPLKITQEALGKRLAAPLEASPFFRKTARISAVQASDEETVDTVLSSGHVETSNVASPGDWIVTNPGGERYVIKSEKFQELYEPSDEAGVFQAKTRVKAMKNNTGRPLVLTTSWGEQEGDPSCYLVITEGSPLKPRIVGEEEFSNTYAQEDEDDATRLARVQDSHLPEDHLEAYIEEDPSQDIRNAALKAYEARHGERYEF